MGFSSGTGAEHSTPRLIHFSGGPTRRFRACHNALRCAMRVDTAVANSIADCDPARIPLAPVPGLVWAFRIHSDGSSESLAVDRPLPSSHDGLLWLHFNLADARALQWLTATNLQLPRQARALLLSKDTYQQLHTIDDCVYGVISDLL